MNTKPQTKSIHPNIKQVRFGQSLVLQRDYNGALTVLKNQKYTLARIWYMTYRLGLHTDIRSTWLDYFLPYVEKGIIRFKRRSSFIGAKRLAMALDAIYNSEHHRAFAIIESVDFAVRVWWHHWLTHKLKSNTWQYDARIKTYKKMLVLLNHFKADSTDPAVIRKIAQRSRPDDPDKYHNLLFEAGYGDGRILEWAEDGYWSVPLHDETSKEGRRRKKQRRHRKSLVQRVIAFLM